MNVHTLEWIAGTLTSAGSGTLRENGVGPRADVPWEGAVVDSRADCTGRVFFALRGENADGNRFAEKAADNGAVAAVVDDASAGAALNKKGIPYLLVDDSLRALQSLARAYRDGLAARIVAVTGSAGKTTTKEYLRRILSSAYRVHANPGNFNSLIGVPLTVLETEPDSEYLVCEVGANRAGEIDFLAELLRPDVGVITNVGDAHVGEFGSVDAIAGAKSELLAHVTERGTAVLPADDAYVGLFVSRTRARVITFGRSPGADYPLSDVETEGARLRFRISGTAVELNAVGEYNALNACAAFAAADVCGVDRAAIAEALADTRPVSGRGRVYSRGGVTVIDESYNASPASMNQSIAALEGMTGSRRLAVLGDMRELGRYAGDRHRGLGGRLAASSVDVVFWFGEEGGNVHDGFSSAGGTASLRLFDSHDSMAEELIGEVRDGDVVLVKASRAQQLDRIVARLLESLDPGTEK